MRRLHRRFTAARAAAFAAFAVAAGICVATPAAAQARLSGERCYRDDYGFPEVGGDYRTIADTCRNRAGRTTQVRETMLANFWAGKAYRRLREWREAEDALRVVAFYRLPDPSANLDPRRRDVSLELTQVDAKLELAEAYRDQNRKNEALTLAQAAIADFTRIGGSLQAAALANFRNRARYGRANAGSILASIHLAPPEDARQALNALHIFIEPGSDDLPNVAERRREIIERSTKIGVEKLEDLKRQRTADTQESAAFFFTLARDAAVAARAPLTDININLGQVIMAANGISGFDGPEGCEAPSINTNQVTQARELFTEAGQKGLMWRGCAQMALGDLDAAVSSFNAAAGEGGAAPRVSLGRAYRRLAKNGNLPAWEQSRAAYKTAIDTYKRARQTGPDRAQAHYELAKVDLEFARTPGASSRPAELVNEAYANLSDATDLLKDAAQLTGDQAWAFLELGELQIDRSEFENARKNIMRARRNASGLEQRAVVAHSHFLVSKLESKLKNWVEAIKNADSAASLGSDVRAPAYYAQACNVRLLSRRVFRAREYQSGDIYCRADRVRNVSDWPDAQLREGTYFLIVGTLAQARAARNGAWDSAYKAFELGAKALPDFPPEGFAPDPASRPELKAQLLAGRGQAMICSGMRSVGTDSINLDIPTNLRQKAREYFDQYTILCE